MADALLWIVIGGLLMSAIALTGSLTLLLPPATLQRLLRPLIALAAGSLLGGAAFHLIPTGAAVLDASASALWVLGGFTSFLMLEQFLHWHHTHRETPDQRPPVTFLILAGDALHNFLGGLGVASTYLINPQAGMSAWLAAAAHEIPQELGDFGVLVHGGWRARTALGWNLASGLTFLAGGLVAYGASLRIDITPLVLLGAGNFIYIGASDLIPEIKTSPTLLESLQLLGAFVVGLAMLLVLGQFVAD